MDSTISAALQEIAKNSRFLSSLNQPFPFNLSGEFFGAFFAAIGAILVALLLDKIRREVEKTNLIPGKIIKNLQGAQYHFRLSITNKSDYIARKVEVDLEKITENDGTERRIVPTPLDWTHRDEFRDIFPHQTAYLNICEVQQEQDKFIKIRAVRIMHLDMVIVKKGTTKVVLRYYQENGQTGEIKLRITWNGNETFNENDLPTIELE